MTRRIRTSAAAGIAALALVSLTGGTAQASNTAASGKWIYLDSIKCNDTEDWNQDELRIEVNGKNILTEFFDPGDKVSIHQYVHTNKATIKLIEQDGPDPDDVIGKHTVSSGSGTLKFTNGANYTLKYKWGHS
ncbi:hypothetical protein [Streptomyces sp. NPDC056948]|uniref:hypothetical protein n=1 Tax=Streptomyces sp. NPDC056948 TaxID=3345975 RepID=UPI003629236D